MSRRSLIYLALTSFIVATAIGFIIGGMAIKGDEDGSQEAAESGTGSSNVMIEPEEQDASENDKPVVVETRKSAEPEIRVLVPGTPWQTNLYIIRGANPGPKMLVLGGVHGDGPASFWSGEAAAELRIENGTLYVIPHLNEVAYRKGTREGAGDINRKFPGDINSSDVESKLCGEVSKLIKEENIKMVMTFHEALGFYTEPPNHPGQTFYYDWDTNPYTTPPADLTGKALQIMEGVNGINGRIKACEHFQYQGRELFRTYVDTIETSATYEMMQKLGVHYAYGCEVCKCNDRNKRVWFHITALTSWMMQEGFKIANWPDVESRIWNGEFAFSNPRLFGHEQEGLLASSK